MATKFGGRRESEIDRRYQGGHGTYGQPVSAEQLASDAEREQASLLRQRSPEKTGAPDGTSPTDEKDKQISDARAAEEDFANRSANRVNNTSQRSKTGWATKRSLGLSPKGKGATGLLITMLFAGMVGFGSWILPSSLPFHFKETLVEKFNDQLTAMDLRMIHMVKNKMQDKTTKGLCTKSVNVRCKYKTMSDRQIRRLEGKTDGRLILEKREIKVAGITRYAVDAITIDGKRMTADTIIKEIYADEDVRKVLYRAYMPSYAIWADNHFKNFTRRLGISKGPNYESDTKEKMQEATRKNANGEAAVERAAGITCTGEGSSRKCTDANGNSVDPDEADKKLEETRKGMTILDNEVEARKDIKGIGKKIAKSSIKSAVTSFALGLGAIDTACGSYLLIRSIGFATKTIAQSQYARAAWSTMNAIDQTKAEFGEADIMTYINDKITATNSIGQSATDAAGWLWATGKDIIPLPSLSTMATITGGAVSVSDEQQENANIADERSRYIVGQSIGADLMGDLISFIGKFESLSGGNADDTCGFVKSAWGQGILLVGVVAGAIAAFFSGGTTAGISIAAQVALSVSIGVAMALITPKLYDMAAGTLVWGTEEGAAFGELTVSGMGALNELSSRGTGLAALTHDNVMQYAKASEEVQQTYIALERSQRSPLDPTSKYTALGSIIFNTTPTLLSLKSPTKTLGTLLSLGKTSIGSILPNASAVDDVRAYQQCPDLDYREFKLATDPNCNVRYGESATALNADGSAIADELIASGDVDEETGEPVSGSDYEHYVKTCIDRAEPINGFSEETKSDPNAKGEDCVLDGVASSDTGDYFALTPSASAASLSKFSKYRIYYMDQRIINGMEEGYADFSDTGGDSDGGSDDGGSDEPVVEMPPEAVASGSGWKLPAGQDYSHYKCADGLTDLGVQTNSGNGTTFRVCQFGVGKVASIMSAIAVKIQADAKADGVDLSLSGPRTGLRTYEDQQSLREENGCPDPSAPSDACSPRTAKPGTSNHETGTAFDWNVSGTGSPQYTWLTANGSKYHLYILATGDEPWHWSTNGG